MIQDRLNDKEHDLQGVQKQSSELLSIAWQKGYQAGFTDGYATRREAEIRPQGEWIDYRAYYKCPFCENWILKADGKPKFCDECGADMRGNKE